MKKNIVFFLFIFSTQLFSQITPTITVSHPTTAVIGREAQLQQLLSVRIQSTNGEVLNSITFNLSGRQFISSLTLYNGGGSSPFNMWMNPLGNTITNPTSDIITFTPNGGEAYNLSNLYLYLIVKLKSDATIDSLIDASCTQISINKNLFLPSSPSPSGSRRIVESMTGTYTVKGVAGPNNFSTLASAFDTLNLKGAKNGVTFLLEDDNIFTENLSGKYIYQTGSSSNIFTFKRSGTGSAKPIIRPASTSNDDAAFTFWGTDYVMIDGISIEGPAPGNRVEYGIRLRGSANNACQNITIQNCDISLDSLQDSRCIQSRTENGIVSSAEGAFSNIKILNNILKQSRFGIYLNEGSGVSEFLSINNEIANNTISQMCIWSDNAGILANDQKDLLIHHNVVKDITTGQAGNLNTWIRGINVNNSVGPIYTYANKVYNIINPGTGTGARAIGIIVNAQTAYTYNNMVWKISATDLSTVSGDEVVRGMSFGSINGIGKHYIYHNTVFLNGTMHASLNQYTHAVSFDNSVSLVELKNNIFVALATGGSGAWRTQALNFNNGVDFARVLSSGMDNNIYYAGTPGAKNILVRNGGTSYTTLLSYKQNTYGKDQHSLTENIPFVSATDLHIQTGIATFVEQRGLPIALATTDIDGDARNASTPDIGADEGSFTISLKDTLGPDISLTPIANTNSLTGPTISVTITDAGGGAVDVASFKPRLWYRRSDNSGNIGGVNNSTYNGWKWVEPTNSVSPFTFTLDYSLLNDAVNTTAGKTIYYFIAAQDNSTTPNLSISPMVGGYTATNVGNFTAQPSSYYSYKILKATPMSGDYLVGAAQPLSTLSKAFATLDSCEISGPVRLLLTDASYSTGTVVLNEITGSSAINTITIKPNTGVSARIFGNHGGNDGLIRLNGADNVIIDGSNTVGGITRDLTIETTQGGSDGAAISIRSLGTGLGSINNIVKNCIIKGPSTITAGTVMGVHSGGTGPNPGNDNDNITIQNNKIYNFRTAIWLKATPQGIHDNIIIRDNEIDSVSRYGIELNWINNVTVEGNSVKNMITGGDNNERAAIHLQNGVTHAVVNKNVIDNVTKNGTVDRVLSGIYVDVANNNANITVTNNMISNVLGEHSTGIRVNNTGNFKILHNTVLLTGDVSTSLPGQDMFHSALRLESSVKNGLVQNNIFINNILTAYDVTRKYHTYCIYVNATTMPPLLTINNNIFWHYNVATANKGFVGRYNGYNYSTTHSWTLATGFDVNSLGDSVSFVSSTNLHINPSKPSKAESAGANMSITTDFDGAARNASTPDIGADEGTFIAGASPLTSTISINPPIIPVFNPNATITLQAKNASGGNLTTGGSKVEFVIMNLTGYAYATFGATYDSTNGRYSAPLTLTRPGTSILISARLDGVLINATTPLLTANNAPTAVVLTRPIVNELAASGLFITKITTTDADAALGDKFTYTFVTGTGSADNGLFQIKNDSLFVGASALAAYATKSSYSVRIKTTDLGNYTLEQELIIKVNSPPTGISLNPPVINDNTASGTEIATILAVDPNGASDSFTFSLVAGAGDNENANFQISGNKLTVNKVYSYTTTPTISIRIRVVDQDNLTFEQAVVIQINVAPTDLALTVNNIAENSAIGAQIGVVSGTDINAHELTYTLPTGVLDNDMFSILTKNRLSVNTNFDFETKRTYSVRLRGTDPGSLYFEKVFTVNILDVYEAPTDITITCDSIKENESEESFIGILKHNDVDSGDVVSFSLFPGEGSEDNFNFKVIGDSLFSLVSFNYESKKTASIRVRARDMGAKTFSKALTIKIVNVFEPGVDDVGTTTTKEDLFEVYPIPATDIVTINYKGSSNKYQIVMCDALGKPIINKFANSIDFNVAVSLLPRGIYIIQIIDNGKTSSRLLLLE